GTMTTPNSILVLGAGVVGMSVGWRLAQAGVRVTVVDRGAAGAGASTAAAGMLAPTAEVTFEEEELLALNQASRTMYPDFVAEVQAAADLDIDYRSEGTLVVGLDRDDTEALDHLLVYQQALGLEAERLSGAEAAEREPALSPSVHSAVWCPSDHQVDPRLLVRALKRACTHAGAVVLEHTEVTEVVHDGARACGVHVRYATGLEEILTADCVLVATGAWTRALGGLERRQKPHVRPVRGQMLALKMPDASFCTHVVRAPDAYLVPKSDGRMIVGATMEEMGFDTRLTAGGVFELLRGAWETMPGVYDMPIVETWTGFRPMTLSNTPVLGPSPHLDALWFATGHGRNGILLTPITGALMSEAILEGRVPEVLRPFQMR
ncbi:MAG: glycine oxidase ThiO, partial [Myxococcota bacterium]